MLVFVGTWQGEKATDSATAPGADWPENSHLPQVLYRFSGEQLTFDFSRTKHKAQKLCEQLGREGYAAGAIHGNRSQAQREQVWIQCIVVEGNLVERVTKSQRGPCLCESHFLIPLDCKSAPRRTGPSMNCG